jgi:hypothetical protein
MSANSSTVNPCASRNASVQLLLRTYCEQFERAPPRGGRRHGHLICTMDLDHIFDNRSNSASLTTVIFSHSLRAGIHRSPGDGETAQPVVGSQRAATRETLLVILVASSLRTLPLQPRASPRSRASAGDPRDNRTRASTRARAGQSSVTFQAVI